MCRDGGELCKDVLNEACKKESSENPKKGTFCSTLMVLSQTRVTRAGQCTTHETAAIFS